MPNKIYPIGIQTLEQIRGGNYVYVDKTRYVYDLTHQFSYVFLSRPRRFGKSLLVSTLKCYFEGKKELFKGLALDELEKDWVEYPVFCFDMQLSKQDTIEDAKEVLSSMISDYEKEYGIIFFHQIDEKGYTIPYECDERKLVKVAVNFNETIRTIDGWRIDRGDGEIEEWFEGD